MLDALHRTGVDTDESLRPRSAGTGDNLFVTGRTLAHWNPATEGSAEGVSIRNRPGALPLRSTSTCRTETVESGLLIGIDHGGTNTTALVLEAGRGKLSSASVPMPKHTPARGWVEHDPEDFLRTSVEGGGAGARERGTRLERCSRCRHRQPG